MATRLSAKRGRYVPAPRAGVEPSKNDDTFSRALSESARAEQKVQFACEACVHDAARMLVRAAAQFDDPSGALGASIAKIRAAVQDGSVPPVGVALSTLLSGNRGELVGETPEANFLYAASCLVDAVHDWSRADYVASHANTVRCRSSLKTITS